MFILLGELGGGLLEEIAGESFREKCVCICVSCFLVVTGGVRAVGFGRMGRQAVVTASGQEKSSFLRHQDQELNKNCHSGKGYRNQK